jgi:hypothetical protein
MVACDGHARFFAAFSRKAFRQLLFASSLLPVNRPFWANIRCLIGLKTKGLGPEPTQRVGKEFDAANCYSA